MKKILGISAFYHDSAAAIIEGEQILAAAQEERFTRKKHTPDFPVNAIRYCLEESGFSIDELDAVVFYDKPLLKIERLLETYYAFAPKGFRQFRTAIPVWLDEKMFIKKKIFESLRDIQPYDKKKLKLLFPEHHISHAASAYYPSTFTDAAILTIDGVGEWATATICKGSGNSIEILKEMKFPHSAGLFYSACTYYLGFRVNSGEYKLMGLAPYGQPDSPQTVEFVQKIKETLLTIHNDGSVWLNQDFFNYATGLKMIHEKKWEQLFGFPVVPPNGEGTLSQTHCNFAFAAQQVTEEIVLKMAREAKRMTGSENLCMAGGVALNCVANGKLVKERLFKNIFIQPAAGDAGGALGAALAANHIYFNQPKTGASNNGDTMQGSYLGPAFSDKEALIAFKKHKADYERQPSFALLCEKVASLLADGAVVGWFQGRMEFGPRALGRRSILGDARNKEMQKKLNLKIKYRESFRPFAPSVLKEDAANFFDLGIDSPYMLLIGFVNASRRKNLPDNYYEMDLWERLYCERSDIQSVTHLDFSARIHTVEKETNPEFWQLLHSFKKQTGVGVLVNTSFNVRGEPIVCTPEDAYRCFMGTEMDYLVINNFLLAKTAQPDWENREKWAGNFKLD